MKFRGQFSLCHPYLANFSDGHMSVLRPTHLMGLHTAVQQLVQQWFEHEIVIHVYQCHLSMNHSQLSSQAVSLCVAI